MFDHFGQRLKRDIKQIVDRRIQASEAASGSAMRVRCVPLVSPSLRALTSTVQSSGLEVNVISHKRQRYAVWFGGSLLASLPDFYGACHTKAAYEEVGPSICRRYQIFGSAT